MITSSGLDLGVTSAKRQNQDVLMNMMRKIIASNPGISRERANRLCYQEMLDHEDHDDLIKHAVFYCLDNMYQRCTVQTSRKKAADEYDTDTKDRIFTSLVIASMEMWWNFKMPTTGKLLCDSTFLEVKEAAVICGKLMSRLAQHGAPGTLVREVFKTQEELQEFFMQEAEKL